jgi:hypothetical protein
MSEKFTSGPWRISISNLTLIKTQDDISICQPFLPFDVRPIEKAEEIEMANARLIAQAPALYEALHEEDDAWLWDVYAVLQAHKPELCEQFRKKMQKARAVLKDIEGER